MNDIILGIGLGICFIVSTLILTYGIYCLAFAGLLINGIISTIVGLMLLIIVIVILE